MELRLRAYFDAQLAHKANSADVASAFARIGDLEITQQARDRGEFTEAQSRSIDDRVRLVTSQAAASAWTTKERLVTLVSVVTGIGAFIVSVILAFHGMQA